jgi:hypothetical protein
VASRDVEKKSSSRSKVPPTQSWKAGDVHYCNLETESCAKEESRLRGFCDIDTVEASSNTSVGVEATTAFDLHDLSTFLASLSNLSLAFWASFSAFNSTFLVSLSL